jgi:hypothetical protein
LWPIKWLWGRIFSEYLGFPTIPVAVRFKAWFYGCSLAGIAGSNPAGGMDVCLL